MTELNESSELFTQAAVLMMVGMAFVFAFLSVLIVAIKAVITPLGNHFPDPQSTEKKTHNGSNHQPVVAAISVAIKKYRQKHPK